MAQCVCDRDLSFSAKQDESAPANPAADLQRRYESLLVRNYGALIGGAALAKVLGYPSQESLRQAAVRGRLPVLVFRIPNRRGRFAHVTAIASWIASIAPEREAPHSLLAEVNSEKETRKDRQS
jgi:hypothetical protein